MGDQAHDIFHDMWKTLSKTLNDFCLKGKDQELGTIVGMIKNRLLFDQSGGIFPENATPGDREPIAACNFWLLHKLLLFLTDGRFAASHLEIVELLKDFLAGCIVNQHLWLFEMTVWKFVELGRDLLKMKDEIVINHFRVEYNLTRIHQGLRFFEIKIRDPCLARSLLDAVIAILASCVGNIAVEGSDLRRECTEFCTNALSDGFFQTKLHCLEYFNKLFKYTLAPLSARQKAEKLTVLMALDQILQNVGFWITFEKFPANHLQTLLDKSLALFESFRKFVKKFSDHDCKLFLQATICIIKSLNDIQAGIYERIKSLIPTLLEYTTDLISHSSHTFIEEMIDEIIPMMEKSPDLIVIFDKSVLKEIANGSGDSVLVRSDTLKKIFTVLNYQSPTMRNFAEHMKFFVEILKMGRRISQETNNLTFFGSAMEDIFDLFEKSIGISIDFAFHDIDLHLQAAQEMIFLPDFKNLSERDKNFLCSVILCPLKSIHHRPASREIPSEFVEAIQAKKDQPCDQLKLELKSLRTLFHADEEKFQDLKTILRLILRSHSSLNFDAQLVLFPLINSAIVKRLLTIDEVQEIFISRVIKDEKYHVCLSESMDQLICILSGGIQSKSRDIPSSNFTCLDCEVGSSAQIATEAAENFLDTLLPLFSSTNHKVLNHMIDCIRPLITHFPQKALDVTLWKPLLLYNDYHIRQKFAFTLPLIIGNISSQIGSQRTKEEMFKEYQEILVEVIVDNIMETSKYKHQFSVLLLLDKMSEDPGVSERTFMQFFKMTFLFIINTGSLVIQEAALLARHMCVRRGVTPRNLLYWYQEDIIKIIVNLSVGTYLKYEVGFYQSLITTAKVLEYNVARDFIFFNMKVILAMLLPWCIQHPRCENLLQEVCINLRKEPRELLSGAFVTIYIYLHLNHSPSNAAKCIDYILRKTNHTVYELLNQDIQKTVSELLMYYHKQPDFVLNAFKSLMSKNELTLRDVIKYIAPRFLGVLVNFEKLIVCRDKETSQKKEALRSLGDIVRFMGPEHITPCRFKILTLLKTVTTIYVDDEFQRITASTWTIVVRTIDVQSLGPLLSTIIVSLEPLQTLQPETVKDIVTYLIVENRNMLSAYFDDLFFVKETYLEDSMKDIVSSQKPSVHLQFPEQFNKFRKHINHENLEVRTYGFKYLAQFFVEKRTELNKMIFDQTGIDPMMVECLDTIMQGCRHIDESLQLAAGECLGELGALEPSHLPPNYAPQKSLVLTIHSDEFAIMALAELCRAYQFQKNSRYVDCFSLAIQDILQLRGVNPKEGKKLNVWRAIPERMRELMEPLLTSSYTGLPSNSDINIHPVFTSSSSMEDWIFVWVSNMIYHIEDEFTKRILSSLKPSIRHDMQTLSMFLPYIIVHALQFSNSANRLKIAEEFQQVFTTVANINEQNDVCRIHKKMRGIRRLDFMPKPKKTVIETENFQIKCAKMAFNQLDFLEVWLQNSKGTYTTNSPYYVVRKFLDQFDQKLLAVANFNAGEYARALQYLECYLTNNQDKLQEELPFLAQIYANLMDPDNVEGAMRMMKNKLPLQEQIAMNMVTGRHSESAVSFEKIMQSGDITPDFTKRLVQYYVTLDQPETALLICEGFMAKYQDFMVDTRKYMLELQAEPLWEMGRFDDLKNLIKETKQENPENSDGWGIRCGSLLLAYRQNDLSAFQREMKKTRLSVLKSLKCAQIEQNSYQKSYSEVLKLHMVTEIEKASDLMQKITASVSHEEAKVILDTFFSDWEQRLKLIQPSTKIVEPILRLRRTLLQESRKIISVRNPRTGDMVNTMLKRELGKLWLKSAELAREEKHYQQARLCLLNLEEYNPKNLFLEKAKLSWSLGDQSSTFQELERGLDDLLQNENVQNYKGLQRYELSLYAEGKFLIASYNAESMNIDPDLNIRYFREAIEALPSCEIALVHYAQFMDKIYNSLSEADQIGPKGTALLKEIMRCYGKSLQYGCKFLYQSMPRLLSIWLDYTAHLKCDKKVSKQMTEMALVFSNTLPSYMFFTAFSQLASRICHPSNDVFKVLKVILVKLIKDFTQQSLWMILSVLKSSYNNRSKRCAEIIHDKQLDEPTMRQLITDFNCLAVKLIDLTNRNIPNHIKDPKVGNLVPELPQLFRDPRFSRIVLPVEKFMQPVMPSADHKDSATNSHNAFPRQLSYIHGVKNSMIILRSMQKPRRITIVADDGLEYDLLMKPKDDLRKDFRLMEFNAVVKQYLRQDPEARQRRLNIRTYAVLPLNEECGIIEWVSNLNTLRSILINLYRQRGISSDQNDVRQIESAREREGKSGKKEIFVNTLCKKHPPVFSDWFKNVFTTPFNWYQARSSYIRTTAVMSMVGYIVGLGDRHAENIMYDQTNGDSVHVDFNCLFNKGESLGVPELVPFRLTQNMVHAMGPLGIEGLYRECCEITMRVLQTQTSTLMSVLRPFVYDPLVSWYKEREKSDGARERTDPQALANLKNIEERLKGYVKINGVRSKIPLSTEGQVNFVIKEAMDINNLCSMYIGWAAWL
ncbi:Serine/threonine-protein kinase ATR [Sergentomyia squamirostris]